MRERVRKSESVSDRIDPHPMSKITVKLVAVAATLASQLNPVQAQDAPRINPKCFETSDKMAGVEYGDLRSDMETLEANLRTDYRLNGFQICSTEPNGKGTLTGFRLITAAEFGDAVGFQDGIILGPGE